MIDNFSFKCYNTIVRLNVRDIEYIIDEIDRLRRIWHPSYQQISVKLQNGTIYKTSEPSIEFALNVYDSNATLDIFVFSEKFTFDLAFLTTFDDCICIKPIC